MAALSTTRPPLPRPDRRSFLLSLASLGFPSRLPRPEKQSEQVYRFLTPVCEVRMSVQYFARSSASSFRFRDDLTNRTFCLSANGEQDRDCLERFVGSMAIAQYQFRSRRHSGQPAGARADNRSRRSDKPRAPFERALAIERAIVSDIQAFGYNPDDTVQGTPSADLLAVWYLVRQDLYLNDQATAFLIVHWKHTLNLISLLDIIPGDGTELISE
jgi:hypothetical protein